ncbi:hypothetical protein [Nonomuraea diastatica]|uniref:Uncharacterized protein n=1 Tax=Nonomuraea diastatica TaxID=1848329 RepID=A0A4R4VP98_9ACTN|nr:hypothetical protein [Nonomuraea diastatica]TDD07718.1 hypothetical protein E1294_48055 [Nonomuraea diastatica]
MYESRQVDLHRYSCGLGVDLTVPAGTRLARVATRDGAFAGASQGLTSDEDVLLPGEGTFDVYVVQWGLPAGSDGTDVRTPTR